jgi:ABC-type thiamin/hydroxymethylpyrimidine transport system permease subunit
MAVTYDERVIVAFAERLYRRAQGIVALYAVLVGGLGAAIAAVGTSYAAHSTANASIGTPALVVGGPQPVVSPTK